jgi:hypothetical protein
MLKKGYIKISRAILYHPSLQKKDRSFCEVGAFIWLLLEASFADRKFRINNAEINLKRGQLCCSLTYMAQAFNWHKSKVSRYLERLIENGTITSETPIGTPADTPNVLTICQYDDYQDTPTDTPSETKHNKLYINKEINDAFEDIWNKLKIKRGTKAKGLKAYNKLHGKIEPNILIEKFNAKADSLEDVTFLPHFSSWLNAEGWTEELLTEKKDDKPIGIIQRDQFRNLPLWQKGIKTMNDDDTDILLKYKQGEITKEAMEKMNFSI